MEQEEKGHTDPHAGFMSIPRGYINSVRIGHGVYEFQLILANVSVNLLDQDSKMLAAPQFVAQMSPQHFKVFSRLINNQLNEYEKEFGVIGVPDLPPKPE